MESIKASQVEEFTKIRDKNEELKGKLQDCQTDLKAFANDNTALNDKVSVLEARVQAAKERVAQEEFSRDEFIREAVEQAVEKFKQFEEYATILATQYDTSNDLGVEETFFNIQRKRQDVDYRFLGIELINLMAGWIDEEKRGILNTRPPPSPQYPEAEDDDAVVEVVPLTEAPEQALPTDAEEEVASDPLSPVVDEAAPTTPSDAAPITLGKVVPIDLEEEGYYLYHQWCPSNLNFYLPLVNC